MKTIDGGLHWETISPDLTGSTQPRGDNKSEGRPPIENAKQRDTASCSPSRHRRSESQFDLGWQRHGLIHLTRDGGKTWKDVTPPRSQRLEQNLVDRGFALSIPPSPMPPWIAAASTISTPYLYRTRDYGATWQLITNGIAAPAFLRAIREDPENKGSALRRNRVRRIRFVSTTAITGNRCSSICRSLPFAISRFTATIWSSPRTAVPSGFLTTSRHLRQVSERGKGQTRSGFIVQRRHTRIDNDFSPGTPLPPEEPTAENPPSGAMIDYFLKSAGKQRRSWRFSMRNRNLVRKFSSEDQMPEKHPPLPIAERWFPKPEVLREQSRDASLRLES